MLIDVERYAAALEIRPSGVLHVGAHEAEERGLYRSLGWNAIAWVEAQSSLAQALQATITDSERVYQGAAWSEAGLMLDLRVTSNSQSSSLRDLADHALVYPDISQTGLEPVVTITLDGVWREFRAETGVVCDLLVLDIQGAELDAMKGLGPTIAEFQWIYTEVSTRELYAGQARLPEVDDFLGSLGFHRVLTCLVSDCGWGDALYLSTAQVARVGPWKLRSTRADMWSRAALRSIRAFAGKARRRLTRPPTTG